MYSYHKNKSYEIKMLLNLYFIASVLKIIFIVVFDLKIFRVILNVKNIDAKHIKVIFLVFKCLLITLLVNKLTDS